MLDLKTLAHQKDYEKLEILLQQHWLMPFKLFLAFLMVCALPALCVVFIQAFMPSLFDSNAFDALAVVGLSMYALMSALFLFQSYLDLHLDIWIVTNERIIAAERQSLFHYTMSELRLYQVQDVKSEMQGFLGNLFGFGSVIVQTAGKQVQFTFENIPNPRDVAQKILALTDADRHFHADKIIHTAPETPNASS